MTEGQGKKKKSARRGKKKKKEEKKSEGVEGEKRERKSKNRRETSPVFLRMAEPNPLAASAGGAHSSFSSGIVPSFTPQSSLYKSDYFAGFPRLSNNPAGMLTINWGTLLQS